MRFLIFFLFLSSSLSHAGINISSPPLSPGSGLPGGSDTQVQFNDGGNFGGDAGLTYLKATDALSCGTLNLSGLTQGSVLFSGASGLVSQDNSNLFWNDTTKELGIGTASPDSILHVKADTPGTIGDNPAGQIIIQALGTSINSNAIVTGYNSDGSGNPNNQLWYLGSSSSSNQSITFLNRIAASLTLGTNGASRLTISSTGDIGINAAPTLGKLHVVQSSNGADTGITIQGTGGGTGQLYHTATNTMVIQKGTNTDQLILDNNGDLTHTNFTKLGSDAPLVKYKKLTGTGGTVEGWNTNVAHGLADISKIISADVLLTPPNGNIIPPGFTTVAEFQYDFFIDATNILVRATATNSGSILVSSSFTILLTLEK